MKKTLALIMSLIMLLGMLAACSKAPEAAPEAAAPAEAAPEAAPAEEAADPLADLPEMTFTYAEEGSETSPRYLFGVAFKNLIEQKSNGKLTITMYANGTMGTTSDISASVMAGDLSFGSVEPGSSIDNRLAVIDAPGIFVDVEKAREVFSTDNDFTNQVNAVYEELGLKNIAIYPYGGRIISTNKEMAGPEDFKGFIMRTPPSDAISSFWTNMGCTATIISMSETYLALQQGLADGQDSVIDVTANSKFYEVNKYIYLVNYMLAKVGIIMNLDAWNALPAEYQAIIAEAAVEARSEWLSIFTDYNQKYLDEMIAAGCTVYENTPEMTAAIKTASESIVNSYTRENSGDAMVDAAIAAMAN